MVAGAVVAGYRRGSGRGYLVGLDAKLYNAVTTTIRALYRTPVVAGGVTYYQCGSTWYNQAYSGDSVTYVTVAPPPGY